MKSPSSGSVEQAYDGSSVYFQLLRACGWGSLLNLGYAQPWDWVIYPFRSDIAQDRLVQRSIALLDIQPEQQVLDVACGKGKSSFLLAMQYPATKITGIDKIVEHTEVANLLYGKTCNLAYQTGDAEALPFADQSFDRIHCLEAAFHFDRSRFLQEAYRVIKPGGCIVIVDFMWKDASSRPLLETPEGKIIRELWQFEDFWTVEEYTKAVAEIGFQQDPLIDWSKPVLAMSYKRMQNLSQASLNPARLNTFYKMHPPLQHFSTTDWEVIRRCSNAHEPLQQAVRYMALVAHKS
jgi:MPBQ/MSBQ methyltransferase